MKRAGRPALGHVMGAVIVTAVFAAATPVLVLSFQGTAENSQGIVRDRLEEQRVRAGEQVAPGGVACTNGTAALLHNYGTTSFESGEMRAFSAANGTITILPDADYSVSGLDGSADPFVEPGDTVVFLADADCSSERVILALPSGTRVELVP